jgi:uncharacterized membrane protein YeaQ/YmgE (transglycosylase-associated protein family)
MYILLWLLFGALVGWMASVLMKKNQRMGLISNIVIGLVGSALGMWLFEVLGFGRVNSFTLAGLIVSVGGAALLISILSVLNRR